MEETKKCTKCGRELPLSKFAKNKVKKDGYNCWCKECQNQYNKQYRQEHIQKAIEYAKQYRQNNKEYYKEYDKKYRSTPMGRASYLVGGYRKSDKDANRGECTLTAKWIIDNIFTSKCHWCDETDWNKLGCDRIDNDKPHTPDNVNPCCDDCNKKRGKKTYEEFLELIKAPVTYV